VIFTKSGGERNIEKKRENHTNTVIIIHYI